MASGYIPLPAPRIPSNAMLDVSGLSSAIDSYKNAERQNAMLEYQRGRDLKSDARADEQLGMQRESFNAKKAETALNRYAGIAQMISQAPPEQQPAMWQRAAPLYHSLRKSIPEFDQDAQMFGVDPNDPQAVGQFIIARQRGYKEPAKPDVKEVKGRLVRVAPDASSATEIYSPQGGVGGYDKDAANIEESLRKEFSSLAKPYFEVRDAYTRVEQSAAQPSAAGDLALIFNYMKMLDPGSVVREGEFATAQSAAGVPDRVWNLYNRILSGERLNPQQRNDFIGQARGLFQKQEQQYQGIQNQYRGITERTGVDPRNTIIDFGRPAGAPTGGGPQPGAVEDGYRFKGGNPADPNSWEPVR